jgi:hypothetical protein
MIIISRILKWNKQQKSVAHTEFGSGRGGWCEDDDADADPDATCCTTVEILKECERWASLCSKDFFWCCAW